MSIFDRPCNVGGRQGTDKRSRAWRVVSGSTASVWLAAFRHDTRGVAAIEAGLSFPFIVALTAGLIELGAVFYNFELMQTGIRDAARYLARVTDPATAEGAARNLAVRGTVDSSGTLRVKWWQASHVQIAYKETPNPIDQTTGRRQFRGPDPLVVVRVSTAVDYDGLGLVKAIGVGPFRISAAHEERHVGE
jgi:hypothetical protein